MKFEQLILIAVPTIPLLSFIILLFFGKNFKKSSAGVFSVIAIGIPFALSGYLLLKEIGGLRISYIFNWLILGRTAINFGLKLDSLSSMMVFVVTLVSFCVQLFSIGYMHNDRRFSWFFAAISLFSFSMLGLVLSPNFLQLYIFWELVGLCSYLLIGFWFEKPEAAAAAKKAFIVTRIGDVGLFLGIAVMFWKTGSFEFSSIVNSVAIGTLSGASLTAAAVLVFCGAVGKSAQFPLHVWLPDAMEGPTPVSALIHAATMVAAGVYLVARAYGIFSASPESLVVVTYIGAFTALLAATIAIVQPDIKRILAYSTISQLGYMMMALGVGSYTAGVFHLMNHAFFKALLFLGSGSVIHATHCQNIFEMGGLRKRMPITFWTFIIGSLALSGIPPLSGFWSKDEIIAGAYHTANYVPFAIGLLVAFLTAFYMFRLIFTVFFGESKTVSTGHAKESSLVMTVPLLILGFLSVTSGWIGTPFFNAFERFIHFSESPSEPNLAVALLSVLVALAGISLAYLVYYSRKIDPARVVSRAGSVYRFLLNKWYFDEIYYAVFVRGTIGTAKVIKWTDEKVVDGIVNGVAKVSLRIGDALRPVQNGKTQNYLLWLTIALVLLIVWLQFGLG